MNRADDLIAILRAAASPEHRSGMSRFGIPTERALGIAVPALRKIARETGTDHPLAVALWDTGWHEARLLAPMIADPRQTTVGLVDRWTQQFDAWDVCRPVLSKPVAPHRVRLRAGRAIRSARGGIRPAHGLRANGGAGDRRQAVARREVSAAARTDRKSCGRSAQFRQESRQLGSESRSANEAYGCTARPSG